MDDDDVCRVSLRYILAVVELWLAVTCLLCDWVGLHRWTLMLGGDSLVLGQFQEH